MRFLFEGEHEEGSIGANENVLIRTYQKNKNVLIRGPIL